MGKNNVGGDIMKKIIGITATILVLCITMTAFAQASSYCVVKGDSLWKISVRHNVKLKDVISANPQIKNPDLIYPLQIINVPDGTTTPPAPQVPAPQVPPAPEVPSVPETPTNPPTPGPTVPEEGALSGYEAEVLRLVNIERSKNGLAALQNNADLTRVARTKSQDMIDKNYFSHTSPTYGSPFTMMQTFGLKFSAAAENIAYGQKTPQEVVTSWMNSQGHRENILSPSYTHSGVGAAKKSNGQIYWTHMFIKPY
jgi:uncharacterized YkwD family protein/spore coat assembly protein SafA